MMKAFVKYIISFLCTVFLFQQFSEVIKDINLIKLDKLLAWIFGIITFCCVEGQYLISGRLMSFFYGQRSDSLASGCGQ